MGLALARGCEGLNAVEHWAESVLLDLKVVTRLQIQPEPLRSSEEASQAQRGVSADPALPVHDLVDPPGRHADRARQLVLTQLDGFGVPVLEGSQHTSIPTRRVN